jgi:hypothetical protein
MSEVRDNPFGYHGAMTEWGVCLMAVEIIQLLLFGAVQRSKVVRAKKIKKFESLHNAQTSEGNAFPGSANVAVQTIPCTLQ